MKALADWVDELHEFPPGTFFDERVGFVAYYRVPTTPPVERTVAEHVALVRRASRKPSPPTS